MNKKHNSVSLMRWIIKQWAPLSFCALLSKVYVGVQSDSFMHGGEKNKRMERSRMNIKLQQRQGTEPLE